MASWSAYADVPPPQDVPYQGTLQVTVDATDVARRIFQVREVVPAQPGPLTLLYPAWLPGHHSPVGPIDKVAGLVITANGQTLPWKRDPLNVNAFHVEVSQGASSVNVAFQFLSPQNTREGRVVMTPEIINLQWSSNTLYPAGYYASRITTQASVK
ncbi:MAG TPA: M61 family peptidase, partial [Rhodanobacter sp.]|nr:M61 family peptidase [Rhodanobacter sp.]